MEALWYVKIHRQIKDNRIFYKPNYLAIFMEIVLSVNHKKERRNFRGDIIDLEKWEGIFFQKEMADKFNISLWSIANILKFLKTENIIEIKTTSKYSIIKLLNWSKYQEVEIKIENELKTNWKRIETLKEWEEYKEIFILFNNNINNAFIDFIKHRKEIKKPIKQTWLNTLIKKIESWKDKYNENEIISFIYNSIENWRQGIFDKKTNSLDKKWESWKNEDRENFKF